MALVDLTLSLEPHARVEFGVGAIDRLSAVVGALGGAEAFVVTDPGLRATGLVDRVTGLLAAAGVGTTVYDRVVANPTVQV
ncbi:MAG: iron-containing alcohol dehydrogenase, partial [Nocardioidaceae bacterium]